MSAKLPLGGDGTSVDLARNDWVVLVAGQQTRLCSCGCSHRAAVIGSAGIAYHSHSVLNLGRCNECRCQSYKPVPDYKAKRR